MRPSLCALDSAAVRPKSTAFVGLGRMGSQMAYNLFSKKIAQSSDSRFVVCDAVPDSAVAFRRSFLSKYPGARIDIVETPGEAARACETVVTMLPSSPQVKTVYCEQHGIIPALKAMRSAELQDSLLIDSTTLDVSVARQVAGEVVLTGARMIDAPVSGGVAGAQAGTLSFLVGGTEASFRYARPLLELMGRRVIHCGSSGAGLGAKICNNLVLGVQQVIVGEAMLLGQKMGLDPAVLASVINNSTGGCWASSVNNPVPSSLPDRTAPCEKGYEGGFATALMLKDLDLARNMARAHESALPVGDAAREVYALAVERRPELGRKDFSSVYVHLRGVHSIT